MDKIKRICLWSGPRNISTALMYSFAQRSDCQVEDEPLYAHYLSQTDASTYHPGAEEIISTMENDGEKVIEHMLSVNKKHIYFFKHMTHHLVNLDLSFLSKVTNIILTRDPKEMLVSYSKVISQPKLKDTGYEMHVQLIDRLIKNGQKPIVIDAGHFLKDPSLNLKKLCSAIDIPFDENMLSWEAGPRPEDGCWAKYWYKNIHQSTGFQTFQKKQPIFPEELKPLLTTCQAYYLQLLDYQL